jgi:hypothetical protein
MHGAADSNCAATRQSVVTHIGAMGLRSISANNRLILRMSSRLRSGSFVALSLKRVCSSSRSSSANSFKVILNKTMLCH